MPTTHFSCRSAAEVLPDVSRESVLEDRCRRSAGVRTPHPDALEDEDGQQTDLEPPAGPLAVAPVAPHQHRSPAREILENWRADLRQLNLAKQRRTAVTVWHCPSNSQRTSIEVRLTWGIARRIATDVPSGDELWGSGIAHHL
jgi:hypothetical protein